MAHLIEVDAMNAAAIDDAPLREKLQRLLDGGLQTEWQDRADSSEAVNRIVARLAAVEPGDYAARLRIAGFTPKPFQSADNDIAQACETCMYYEVHSRFCTLPELRLPVRPEWSCRLWRI